MKTWARFALSRHVFDVHSRGDGNYGKTLPDAYTPELLRRVYSADGSYSGKGIRIAVISAFDNQNIKKDFEVFCRTFALPETELSVYRLHDGTNSGTRGWLTESALDVQWARVFAPDAQISVVFSEDAQVENLLAAAEFARKELSADIICMCFGTDESAADAKLSDFMKDGGIFVASSGDTGGKVSFPSTSPCCLSVGGTNLTLSMSGGRISETAWIGGGGGKSNIFEIPMYQGRFFNIYGMADGMRGTPDVSMMANYNPGVPVYVSQLGGWTAVGGTSLACACFAGICACIKERHPEIVTSEDMLSFLYSKAGGDGYDFYQYNFHDITIGKSGENYAERGWDFATGLGSPIIRQLLL